MSAPKISKRAFLKGAGGLVVALPVLDSLGTAKAAAESAPLRYLSFVHHQGTLVDQWMPTGVGPNFQLSPILAPLEPVKDDIVVVSGVYNPIPVLMEASNGHNAAGRSLLTVQPYNQTLNPDGSLKPASEQVGNDHAAGPSFDQVLSNRIAANTPYPSLEFGVGGSRVREYQMLFAGANDPIPLEGDPRAAFERLFTDFSPEAPSSLQRLRAHRKSVLDAVAENFNDVRGKVSPTDRQRLDAHADKIRELELRLDGTGQAGVGCDAPVVALGENYDEDDPSLDNLSSRTFIDVMVMALACDLARVGTLQYTHYQGPWFPWLGQPIPGTYSSWHAMIHEVPRGGDPAPVAAAMAWYMDEMRYLIEQMRNTPDGDGSLLDHSLVMSISEFGDGGRHRAQNLPIVLAGGVGGALETGRHRDLTGACTGDLFATFLNLFGYEENTFGYDPVCTGPVVI